MGLQALPIAGLDLVRDVLTRDVDVVGVADHLNHVRNGCRGLAPLRGRTLPDERRRRLAAIETELACGHEPTGKPPRLTRRRRTRVELGERREVHHRLWVTGLDDDANAGENLLAQLFLRGRISL